MKCNLKEYIIKIRLRVSQTIKLKCDVVYLPDTNFIFTIRPEQFETGMFGWIASKSLQWSTSDTKQVWNRNNYRFIVARHITKAKTLHCVTKLAFACAMIGL